MRKLNIIEHLDIPPCLALNTNIKWFFGWSKISFLSSQTAQGWVLKGDIFYLISFVRGSLLSMALPLWFLRGVERRSIIKRQEKRPTMHWLEMKGTSCCKITKTFFGKLRNIWKKKKNHERKKEKMHQNWKEESWGGKFKES